MVQNSASRLKTGTHERERINLVLLALHWLPILQRVELMLLLLRCTPSRPFVYIGLNDSVHARPIIENRRPELVSSYGIQS